LSAVKTAKKQNLEIPQFNYDPIQTIGENFQHTSQNMQTI
jgi:hypothetical protein